MKKLIFADIKDRLIEEMNKKDYGRAGIFEPLNLMDGFSIAYIDSEMSRDLTPHKPIAMPIVMLSGAESGRIYQFAVKEFIKDLELLLADEVIDEKGA